VYDANLRPSFVKSRVNCNDETFLVREEGVWLVAPFATSTLLLYALDRSNGVLRVATATSNHALVAKEGLRNRFVQAFPTGLYNYLRMDSLSNCVLRAFSSWWGLSKKENDLFYLANK
jgi:hypothetical protein